MATVSDAQTSSILRALVAALEDKKAEQLKVMNVGGLSDITDFLVLATGNSEPHPRALRIEAEKIFDAAKLPIAGTEQGGYGSGWTVMDAYQIMVHFFTAEQRVNYALDKLWKDAVEIDLKTMAAKVAAPAKPKVAKAPKAKAPKTAPRPRRSSHRLNPVRLLKSQPLPNLPPKNLPPRPSPRHKAVKKSTRK